MKSPIFLLCALFFAAGAGGYAVLRQVNEPRAQSFHLPAALSGSLPENGALAGGVAPEGVAEIMEADPHAILAFLGLRGAPTLNDVFDATGVDRPLRMALFLQNATSDELKLAIDRCREEQIYDLSLTDAIWLKWVEIDREAAFAHDPSGSASWWAWTKVDPEAAFAAAQDKPGALETVIRALGQSDPARAQEWIARHPAMDTVHVWDGILDGLSKADVAAAARMAFEKMKDPEARHMDFHKYVTDWVGREPAAALEWAQALPGASERRRAMDAVLKGLITTDPAAALREIAHAPPGYSRFQRTAEAVVALSGADPETALQAANALPNSAERRHALAALAGNLAARDPSAALSIMSGLGWKTAGAAAGWIYSGGEGEPQTGHLEPDRHAPEPAANPVSALARTAPQETLEALKTAPEAASHAFNLMYTWAGNQPEAASAWLARQPAGDFRDHAIKGLVSSLTHSRVAPDYDAALQWAAAASPEARTQMMIQPLLQWRQKEPEAARAAFEALPLTETERQQLSSSLFP